MKKEEIALNELKYYIPNRYKNSCSKVMVTKVLDDIWMEVQSSNGQQFRWKFKWLFRTEKAALSNCVDMIKEIKKAKAAKKATKHKEQHSQQKGA